MVCKCCYCGRKYNLTDALYSHMEDTHSDMMDGLPAEQVFFNFKNKYPLTKKYGKSVVSGKPTKFNLQTGKYERFADDRDKELYREYFLNNMRRRYGKDTLLTDPEHQKKMLANRHISGTYKWSDNQHEFTYTGSYEKKFLEFLDTEVGWENPGDILAPAPMVFQYLHPDGKIHFHIPDFYIGSINTIINIKSADNKGYRLRDFDIERAQDEIIKKSNFNYIKIFDNDFDEFINYIEIEKTKKRKG